MESLPGSFYVHRLKPKLATVVWRPATSRLLWLPVHAAVIVGADVLIARRAVPWPVLPVASLIIGVAFAGLMFLGHEVMHGAVLRGRWAWAKSLVGWLCFAPLFVPPRLWSVWHNRVHHAHANELEVDPDMYPAVSRYRASKAVRFAIDHFAPGGRRRRGVLSLIIGFSVQSVEILITARQKLKMSSSDRARAVVEMVPAIALWATLAITLGFGAFVFAYVLPLGVANVIVMSFILTNHSLSPATNVGDPLIGALSVTCPRWLEWLTLDFGYHVEHHLFPGASARHGRAIRQAIVELWPHRYQSMPLGVALRQLFTTGRVYRDATTLIDPRTGGEWSALGVSQRRAASPVRGAASER